MNQKEKYGCVQPVKSTLLCYSPLDNFASLTFRLNQLFNLAIKISQLLLLLLILLILQCQRQRRDLSRERKQGRPDSHGVRGRGDIDGEGNTDKRTAGTKDITFNSQYVEIWIAISLYRSYFSQCGVVY